MGRLYETDESVNDTPVFPLDRAGPHAIATAAVAHALLALVEEVHALAETVDYESRFRGG